MRLLRRVIDFFSLRPFFTLWLLRAFWWIYIFVWVFELYDGLYRRLTHLPGPMIYLWFRTFTWFDLAFLPLSACVTIMAARLLLEVLVNRLSIANRNPDFQGNPRSGWQTFEAFIELTPLVTRAWLESFWWLFLISTAWVVTSNILLGPSKLSSVLGAITYVTGMRLLVELALRLFVPDTTPTAAGPVRSRRSIADVLLSVQRFLTFGDIKVIWWLYILVELYRLYLRLGTFTLVGSLPPSLYRYMWHSVVVAPLMTLVTIATVRLFLEVLLLSPPEAETEVAKVSRNPRTLSDDLRNFIDLRPFFTPSRLQLFWWLFLFTILADVYGYISLVPGQQPILHWVPYLMDFLKPLYCVVGVRLLIEAALREVRDSV